MKMGEKTYNGRESELRGLGGTFLRRSLSFPERGFST